MTQKKGLKPYARHLQKVFKEELGTEHPYMSCLHLAKKHWTEVKKTASTVTECKAELVRIVFEDLRRDDD